MRYIVLIMVALPVRTANAEESALTRYEFSEPHMGTTFGLAFYAPDKETAEKASKAVFERVEELNRIMSDYSPTSELMQLCKKNAVTAGEPVKISKELFAVLAKSRKISELSDGAFDVTVGPVVKLWRVARKTEKMPDPKVLAEALKKVGYKNIELDAEKQTVKLLIPGMQIDLGGIAKGYAADEGLAVLAKFGIKRAMVAASGDIAVGDPPPEKEAWRIEIGKLTKKSQRRIVLLKNAAVSTSGDAEQFVEIDGVRYSHLVDPKTGIGLTGRRSVTVIAPKGILADSLTKPASIMPPDKAIEMLGKLHAETLIVQLKDKGEETVRSKGFDAYLAKE
jgi:thiamine biosynthesis lipoprotein